MVFHTQFLPPLPPSLFLSVRFGIIILLFHSLSSSTIEKENKTTVCARVNIEYQFDDTRVDCASETVQ